MTSDQILKDYRKWKRKTVRKTPGPSGRQQLAYNVPGTPEHGESHMYLSIYQKALKKERSQKMKPLISTTAVQRGRGKHPYKTVSFLTPEERTAVRRGQLVFFQSEYKQYGTHGTKWRKVIYAHGRYHPRCLSPDDLALLHATTDHRSVENQQTGAPTK